MTDKPFRFQLAYSETPSWEYFEERMPWICSFKLDGIRAAKWALAHPQLISRTIKPFPSAFAQRTFALTGFEGLDGELIVPKQQGPTIYHDTYSAVMTHGCNDPVLWWLFDFIDYTLPFYRRLEIVRERVDELVSRGHEFLRVVDQRVINTIGELKAFELEAVNLEYEGLIARDPNGMYLGNRSSLKQRNMIKLTRKIRFEVEILDMEEMMRNDNEATIDARGFTVRTSHQANQTPLGMMGKLICRRLTDGVVFKVGTGQGLDHPLRKEIFDNWPRDKGRIVMVESKPYGEKDAPRQPSLLADLVGWRDPIDMETNR